MTVQDSSFDIPLILFSTQLENITNLQSYLTGKGLPCTTHILDFHSSLAKRNFVRLLYAHESWWDERRVDHFAKRIIGNGACILFVRANPVPNLRLLKLNIREYLNVLSPKAPHLHVPDYKYDADWLATVFKDETLLFWLHSCYDSQPPKLKKMFHEWNIEISHHEKYSQLVVSGSVALSFFGLTSRAPNDFDFVPCFAWSDSIKPIPNITFGDHKNQLIQYLGNDCINSLLSDSFTYKYLRICNPSIILQLKGQRYLKRGLYKDLFDLLYAHYKYKSLNIKQPVDIASFLIPTANYHFGLKVLIAKFHARTCCIFHQFYSILCFRLKLTLFTYLYKSRLRNPWEF